MAKNRTNNFGQSLILCILFFVAIITSTAQKPELYIQTGHAGPIYSVAYSPDGRLLATASQDKTIKLWDLSSNLEIRTLKAHQDSINCVTFSPDGKFLASSGVDRLVHIWNVSTGEIVWTYEQPKGILAVGFSPNGNYFAVWGNYGEIFDAGTWTKVRDIRGPEFGAPLAGGYLPNVSKPFSFSPDSTKIAANSEYTLKIFDVATGKILRDYKKQIGAESVEFSPDGKILAVSESDYKGARTADLVTFWDAAKDKKIGTISGHPDSINTIKFSPDGKIFATSSNDKTVKLWNVATRSEIKVLAGHKTWVNSIDFSPDGKMLASASGAYSSSNGDYDFRLWDLTSGTEVRNFSKQTYSNNGVLVDSGRNRLISISTNTRETNVDFWDLAKGQKLRTLKLPLWALSAAVSPVDGNLITGNQGGTATLWNSNDGRAIRVFSGHKDTVYGVAITSDGKTLATGSADYTIKLWDIESGRELYTLQAENLLKWEQAVAAARNGSEYVEHSVFSVAFSPDGKYLASANRDRTFCLWDMRSKTKIRTLNGYTTGDGDIIIRNSSKANSVRTLFSGLVLEPLVVSFSPDGKFLVGSVGGTGVIKKEKPEFVKLVDQIKVWKVDTGAELYTLRGHREPVSSISFSSDSQNLISSSGDRSINLWSLKTGSKIKTFNTNTEYDVHGVFLPGKNIVFGASQNLITLWDANFEEPLAALSSVSNGNDWLVVAPDGLFDGTPSGWKEVLWRFARNTFDIAPMESFFNEYYYPNLLSDVIEGKRPKAAQNISQSDRRQPYVQLLLKEPANAGQSRMINVQIKVDEIKPDAAHPLSSGVRDVRLFRNGSLVKAWRGNALPAGKTGVVLEATIPIVAGDNELTAYAFNRDNIKSRDAVVTVKGAEAIRRPGKMYIIAIGINKYKNSQYDLKYTVADAQVFAAELQKQQSKINKFSSTEVIPLFDADSTKANIMLAFDLLAGKTVGNLPTTLQTLLGKLQKAQPEDAIVVYFAGHGTAQQNRFYLIPHDLGYQGSRTQLDKNGLQEILSNSISDLELEESFEHIDSGNILLVIDACNSGQALESEEKRRGPMNSKGLAQLAYEKGMYILTAAQSYQAALEASQLGHGYLTYVLVEEGLKTKKADYNPLDGQTTIREWLDFTTERVPQMQQSLLSSRTQSSTADGTQSSSNKAANTKNQKKNRQLTQNTPANNKKPAQIEQQDLQRPRVFYRREADRIPLIISRQ